MAVSRGIRIRFRDRIARVGIKDILLYAVMICLVAFTALPLIYYRGGAELRAFVSI